MAITTSPFSLLICASLQAMLGITGVAAAEPVEAPLAAARSFGGVYPHLAMFNGKGECGIGGIVPWADRLWVITYPPHERHGSPDKLYAIDAALGEVTMPQSVGGTHACRMIHRESDQLIIGPYFIDRKGTVRVADISQLTGRLTAVARHLTDPANRVYFYDMEGALFEVDVHTLAVRKLFDRCAPGCHGKGAYTAQGHLVISNNGEGGAAKGVPAAGDGPGGPEAAGVLAEWDGTAWTIVQRRQFTEVTGPGGLDGSPDERSPLWSLGWDRRSVLLALRDGGAWSTFRLPKASHAFDPRHGWYTEWPRIRDIGQGRMLMAMHGMLYDFPRGFSTGATGGIEPICSHLRYITDFCAWNGRLVIASDDTSTMGNPLAGQSQSNLWFGSPDQLPDFGPRSGWGGPWLRDDVVAGTPSEPFLINGFTRRAVHLAAAAGTSIAIEVDATGNGHWTQQQTVRMPESGYAYVLLPTALAAQWIHFTADRSGPATAYLHCATPRPVTANEGSAFTALADVGDTDVIAGVVRPSAANRNLQWTPLRVHDGAATALPYREIDQRLAGVADPADRSAEVAKTCAIASEFTVDAASVVLVEDGQRWRLPKGDAAFDKPFAFGWPRAMREVQSERFLMNVHGTMYERPREHGLPLIRPICSHRKQIMDFCTWRGLLVLSGTRPSARADDHYAASDAATGNAGTPSSGALGLWFGMVDDLWKLGKPVGHGGPWRDTPVVADAPSDPYLMTGYDRKSVRLSHTGSAPVAFTIAVDPTHGDWFDYQTVVVPPGQIVTHVFPDGFSAHWVRLRVDKACVATAEFLYE